jgi:hypothetical protein
MMWLRTTKALFANTAAKIAGWWKCQRFDHALETEYQISKHLSRIRCARCGKAWLHHSSLHLSLIWDKDIDKNYGRPAPPK